MRPDIHLKQEPRIVKGEHCSLWTAADIYLFREGLHYKLYRHLGAHPVLFNEVPGVYFAVWAPSAVYVSVIGDFNHWDSERNRMAARWDSSGIWEIFIPGIATGSCYKFHIRHPSGHRADKADPFAFEAELPPHTASKISTSGFEWTDKDWMEAMQVREPGKQPMSIYELHLGSWRRVPEEGGRWLSYREMAELLPAYLKDMGFTHVEFMPLMEHPFYGSWGYQVTGYFAASARYGTPDDLRYLINELHRQGIAVLLDWVPAHFPGDAHGLYFFDGSHLYEHADPREGFHPDWKSFIFNYGRNEVRSFLISSACFWIDEFHIDGIRVDGVASMLYRDYSRPAGEWIPNQLGGRENLEAIGFLQELNSAVHRQAPAAVTIAEESTAFPGVTKPVTEGGLGFDFKWMMGWMHDTLEFMQTDPLYRTYHQDKLVFGMHYFYSEKFVLPLSHDEVVHGKGALMNKMPGDPWQQAANLRLLLGFMFGHPGAKMLFMAAEFGQLREWRHEDSLDWHLLGLPLHRQLQALVRDLNALYTGEPALYERDYEENGFEWVDFGDRKNSVLCWLRKAEDPKERLLFVLNATPVVHYTYRIGTDGEEAFSERLNTDAVRYGGSGVHNPSPIPVLPEPAHGRKGSVVLTLPPLAVLVLKPIDR